MTVDCFSIWSSGVVISCIVAYSSLVDRPSKYSVQLVLRLRTISLFLGFYVGCISKFTG